MNNNIIFMSCYLILYLSSDSVSLPFILDVGASSLWEIDRCIEYTGVQGIAASGKDYFSHSACVLVFILLHEKFLQFDWLR